MGMVQHIETAFSGRNDRVVSALVAGLEWEFGRGAAEGLARHFLEAEEVDFRWDARSEERWLGIYEDPDDAGFELDRVAICGRLDGQWFTAIMLVDGEGNAHGMTGCRVARDRTEARDGMVHAH
ncbi:hypothetical protein JQK15_08715 [Sphingobium sp. BHU LFT2]|uniref:hypothetical protein n=1 Tax=Sphingobium sp. BHU LFT2 TaxID=2807634 RepID=UPI001BE99173|nr:hypothetical protein [Sphingobium sp. BHU LFT2]MBT2243621.1 hypothetical protein [Sphingobium sp. BHU LFT2]